MRSNMSPMGNQNNSMYRLQPGRLQHQSHELNPHSAVTPHSAVSSFNLPASYDSNLITPVSMSSSPIMPAKSAPVSRMDIHLNLSPSVHSPTTYQLGWESESYSPAYNPPMKHKYRHGLYHASSTDPVFPPSPSYMDHDNNFYGSYPLSASASSRASEASPRTQQSPSIALQSPLTSVGNMSAGGHSSSSHHSMHHQIRNGSLYPQSNAAPILIAPSPTTFRPATAKQEDFGSYRHCSISSNNSEGTSNTARPSPSSSHGSQRRKNQKRKRGPPGPSYEEMVASGVLSESDRLLVYLIEVEKLQWKPATKKWCEIMKQEKTVATLQMRRKRLRDKMTSRALQLAKGEHEHESWEVSSANVRQHAGAKEWPKYDVKKHYDELHSNEYETPARQTSRASSDGSESLPHSPWSDDQESTVRYFENADARNLASALSSASIDEERMLQQQQQQQQQHPRHSHSMYQPQQLNWGTGS